MKLKFPTGETIVSLRRNQRFQCMKLLVFAVLIYSHISILVHNREDTIQNHTSLLYKSSFEMLQTHLFL